MFNIARFSEQFNILFRQNKNRHGMILGIFIAFQLFSYISFFFIDPQPEVDGFFKTAYFLIIILCIVASQDVFNKLRNTPSGIQYLMTPATITEKYAAAWLYSSLFVFITSMLTFWVVQLFGISVGSLITGIETDYGMPTWKKVLEVFYTMMFTHSIFFFGSLLFRKNPIIKTAAAYMGIVFLLTLVTIWFAKEFFNQLVILGPENVNISINGAMTSSINGINPNTFLSYIGMNIEWILGGITLLLWGGSYLLLNKKQI